jgi:hypothetical protein
MPVIGRLYAAQWLEFRAITRGIGLGDSIAMVSPFYSAPKGGPSATKVRHQERSCRHNEFVIYMRGGISFIYFGPSFKARRDPFWI